MLLSHLLGKMRTNLATIWRVPAVQEQEIDADALVEPVETFRLRLSNPVNASILPTALTEIRIRNGVDAGFADGFEGSCVN